MSVCSKAQESHQYCAVCGPRGNNPSTLGVCFERIGERRVQSQFVVESRHQGYSGLLHGGIASSLVDAAMTHCLFIQGILGLTAELNVRFHHPIRVGDTITIAGEIVQVRRGIYQLVASLTVNQVVAVSATGKFLEPKDPIEAGNKNH